MPNIIAKLLLAMVALVAAPFIFVMIFAAIESTRWSDEMAMTVAAVVSLVAFGIAWTWLWWNDVRWTRRRAAWTFAWLRISAVAAIAIAYVMVSMMRSFYDELFISFAAGLCYLMWIVSSILCWRETRAERGARISKLSGKGSSVPCPTCGYDMTGLKEAKCPECGAAYTLDQLYLAWRPEHETLSASSPHTS